MSEANDSILAKQVVDAIREVVGKGEFVLHEPNFDGNEWLYLKDCLDSTYVSSVGKFVDRFEVELSKLTGAKHAIATVNGTAALHIALKLAGVHSGDEVLMPTLTFVATPNAVNYCNASPHFVDSEIHTLGIDTNKLRDYLTGHTEQRAGLCINRTTGQVIRAMVPMHAFGHPADIEGLLAISKDFNIVIVEDAAEALGSYYNDRHTGTFGRLGILSFNGNKVLTTGGGGAILTNDRDLALRAKHITTTAKLPHAWEYIHDEIGYNYRLPNINAALGCAQLEKFSQKLTEKRLLYKMYQKAFSSLSGIELFTEPTSCKSNYWLQTLLLDSNFVKEREMVLQETNKAGLMTRPAWRLMHELPFYSKCPCADLSMAVSLSKRIINIPSSHQLVKTI